MAAAAQADPDGVAARRRKKRRRAKVIGTLAAVCTLVLGGAVGGYYAQNEWSSRQAEPEAAVVTVEVPAHRDNVQTSMPDVRGLAEAAARQLLVDAGVDPAKITATTEPAAGPAGTVIDQTPATGTGNPSEVSLVLSTEAKMPEFQGRNGQQLAVELQKLGAEVELVTKYQPGAVPGNAVAVTPAPGSPQPKTVQVVVAEPGSSIYLGKLSAVSGGCSTNNVSLNGKQFSNSLSCSAGTASSPDKYEWVTKRAADQLTATVGISDSDDQTGAARVDVFADGRRVASVVARYGTTADLNAIITGALRITVVVTRVGASDRSVSAVLGDARLIGSADAIKVLES